MARQDDPVHALAVLWVVCLLAAGCGDTGYDSPRRSVKPEMFGVDITAGGAAESREQVPPKSSAQSAPATAQGAPAASGGAGQGAGQATGGAPMSPSAAPQPDAQATVREKADVGAGRKGHYREGIITTPLSVYWRAQERIAFQVQIPHALQLYKATNGHYPRTQEEFVNEILTPNGVKLPELPQGHRYVYDPEKGELLVEHPAP